MIVTVKLRGLSIHEAATSCRRALDEFAYLHPSYDADGRGRDERAVSARERSAAWLSARRISSPSSHHASTSHARRTPPATSATRPSTRTAVHRSLRVLSLFLADYLMRPDAYVSITA